MRIRPGDLLRALVVGIASGGAAYLLTLFTGELAPKTHALILGFIAVLFVISDSHFKSLLSELSALLRRGTFSVRQLEELNQTVPEWQKRASFAWALSMWLKAVVGVASAFAGVITSYDQGAFFTSLGDGYLLQTLAAVFLGGTSVLGGTGTILGTFIGSYIIGAIEPGTVAIGLTGSWTELLWGFVIVISVAMHTILRRRIS